LSEIEIGNSNVIRVGSGLACALMQGSSTHVRRWFRVSGFGFRVSGLGVRRWLGLVSGFGFRCSSLVGIGFVA